MVHFRDSALERARGLERELLAICFGLPLERWQDTMLEQMFADRWYRPDAPAETRPRVAARVGAFIGFGGRFAEPPLVVFHEGELLLAAAGARYSLHADAFGACVQPHGEGAVKAQLALPAGWRLQGVQLSGPGLRLAVAELGAITSAAASADTLVLTHAWSHAATVLALA